MNNVEEVYRRFIDHLDAIGAFLDLAHEEVFDVVREHYEEWVDQGTLRSAFPDNFTMFSCQIANSALVLGYSYFEAFLGDLVRSIYKARPEMLPRDKQLKYSEILEVNDYQALIDVLIEKEIQAMFYKSLNDVAQYFHDRLNVTWPEFGHAIEAAYIRNCILHNSSRANKLLASISKWQVQETIALSPSDIHGYGIEVRRIAKDLFNEVQRTLPSC
jgi:hypothetical protein